MQSQLNKPRIARLCGTKINIAAGRLAFVRRPAAKDKITPRVNARGDKKFNFFMLFYRFLPLLGVEDKTYRPRPAVRTDYRPHGLDDDVGGGKLCLYVGDEGRSGVLAVGLEHEYLVFIEFAALVAQVTAQSSHCLFKALLLVDVYYFTLVVKA